MTYPTNMDDVIDSRDVIEAIEELEAEQEDLKGEWDGVSELDAPADFLAWEREHGEELDKLREFAKAGEDSAEDWEHGATLIRDSYFKTYAMEFADDIGAIDANAKWPLSCIDWDQAARELRMGYTSIEFDGVTYWTR